MPSTRSVSNRNRQARDTGLRRVAKMTRWSLAGALTGTGLFAGLAAQVGHGTTAAPAPVNTGSTQALRTTASSSRSDDGHADEEHSSEKAEHSGDDTEHTYRSGTTSSNAVASRAPAASTATLPATVPATPAPSVVPYQAAPANGGGAPTMTSGAS